MSQCYTDQAAFHANEFAPEPTLQCYDCNLVKCGDDIGDVYVVIAGTEQPICNQCHEAALSA